MAEFEIKELQDHLETAERLLRCLRTGSQDSMLNGSEQTPENLLSVELALRQAQKSVSPKTRASIRKSLKNIEKPLEIREYEQQQIIKLSAIKEKVLADMLRLGLQDLPLDSFLEQSISILTENIPWLGMKPEAAVFLKDSHNKRKLTLKLMASTDNFSTQDRRLCAKVPFGKCLCGRAAQQGSIIFASSDDPRHDLSHQYKDKHKHYCVPIQNEDGNLGVLLLHVSPAHIATDDESVFLEQVADAMSLSITNSLSQTGLVAAKREAEYANRAKSEFLARMSHELRTPLNAILGFGELLLEDPKIQNEEQKEGLEHIIDAGQHLLHLINEVLDIAKVDAGEMKLSLQTILLEDSLRSSIFFVQPLADKYGVNINASTGAIDRYIVADPQRLRQVLVNLLSNAVKYNYRGGQVSIHCHAGHTKAKSQKKNMLTISVTDTGFGIDKKDHHKIFEPFQRITLRGENIEGTGVGLSITQKIVELMSGNIGFESEVGKGSTFWITLPMAENKPKTPLETHTPNLRHDGSRQINRILYIEDNSANLKLMEQFIKTNTNCTLLSASNAEHGIKIARSQQPDLIFMDINLPGIDGFQALDILQRDQLTEKIPVIALSAHAMPYQIEKGKRSAFKEYLTKPVNLNRILEVIDSVETGELV